MIFEIYFGFTFKIDLIIDLLEKLMIAIDFFANNYGFLILTDFSYLRCNDCYIKYFYFFDLKIW
jgi:hypothetical protein